MKKNSKFVLLLFLLFVSAAFIYSKEKEIDTFLNMRAQAQDEPDAVAVRILPNPDHLDPLRWYKEQGFKGDPERITVDGYNGIKNDRTAYVNVGHESGGDFYNNIYVFSYTQDASANTVEIFNRFLDNWTFNTNQIEEEDDLGYCAISTINCVEDDDCSEEYKCSDNRKCVPEDPIRCYKDSACPDNIYCDSDKAKTTRDTERLAGMKEIEILADHYKDIHGHYPKLEAGTYLSGKTVSVWPSWEDKFQQEMSDVIAEYSVFNSLPRDPINRLARCSESSSPQYDQTTCWDEQDKTFAGDVSEDSIVLPTHSGTHPYTGESHEYESHAYTYVYGSFDVCSPLENPDIINVGNFFRGSCTPDSGNNASLRRSTENNPPEIMCGTLSAHPGSELSAYIQAQDPDGDAISDWSISGADWSGWSLELQESPMEGFIRVYSPSVGEEGTYDFQLTATDNQGNSGSATCGIEVGNSAPSVSVDCDNQIRVNDDYSCNINVYEPDGDEVSYDISGLPPGLSHSSGYIQGTPSSKGEYPINISVEDPFGKEDSTSYTLRVNTYCGDGTVQNPNGEGVEEECDDGEDNGEVCDPDYNDPCEYCSNSCQLISKNAPGECGNGIVEAEYGEDCDPPNESDNCNENCHWGCFNYDEDVSLSFAEGSQAQLAKDESTTLSLPVCTGVKTDSFKVDVEMIDVSSGDSMGVVFVTDTSGSMGGEIGDVREAIKDSIDQLNSELTNPTEVGLVEFSSSLESSHGPLELNNSNADTLKNYVDSYNDGGGTDVSAGTNEAYDMLSSGGYDDKIMVILADGDGGDPELEAAKGEGMEIYTIAYGGGAPDMEDWATDPSYAYSGSDADQVYNDITESIITSPEGDIEVVVNGNVNTIEAEDDTNVSLSGVSCDSDNESLINFSNNFEQGEVRYSNPRIDICTID
ncbi:MAG: putative Ig domain-containing protein [Patescibacteria group bacterium]